MTDRPAPRRACPVMAPSPRHPRPHRAARRPLRRRPPARDRHAGPARRVRRAAGPPAVAHRGAPARRPDRPARRPRRRLPRCAREPRIGPARPTSARSWRSPRSSSSSRAGPCCRGGPRPDPTALADEGPDPEAELRARLILYRAYRDAGLRLADGALTQDRPVPPGARCRPRRRAGRRPTRRRAAARPDAARRGAVAPRHDRAAAARAARGHGSARSRSPNGPRSSAPPCAAPRRSCSRTCWPASATGWSSRSRSWRCSS